MDDAKNIMIEGNELKCPLCGNDRFFEFNVRLNTLSTTFFSGIWSFFAKKVKAQVCSKCGLKQEFLQK